MKKTISVFAASAVLLSTMLLGISGCDGKTADTTFYPETAPTTTELETQPTETTPTTTEPTRVTNQWTDFSDKVDGDELLARGQEHFQEELDSDLEIDSNDASEYAVYLDGPVVTMQNCPAIESSEYFDMDHDELIEEVTPIYISVEEIGDTYPLSYYTPKTNAPEIYFIVEKMGGRDAGFFNLDTGEVDYIVYFMVIRISVRDIKTDELICWFEAEMGQSHDTLVLTNGMCDDLFIDNNHRYLRSKGGNAITPLYCLYRFFPDWK